MKTYNNPITILLLISFFALPNVSFAQPGSLDLSFGNNGKVTTAMNNNYFGINSVAIQADGKIVVVGYLQVFLDDFALFRYNPDGSLDNTFGIGGKVITDVGGSLDAASSVTIQPDGKILVAGTTRISLSNNDFAVVRYNTNGSLDNTFGIGGIVKTSIINSGNQDAGNSIAIQTDGKIVVAGGGSYGSNHYFAIVRYYTNGSLDSTFDADGIDTTSFGVSSGVTSVCIQSDAKIVVAGIMGIAPDYDFALARYNTNGSLDTTFDNDGKVTTSFGSSYDYLYSEAIQSDGKIVVAGGSYNGSKYDFVLARYNTDGSLDTTFDIDGKVTTSIGASGDMGRSVSIQSDGKILVAGYTYNVGSSNYNFALVRYNANGNLDSTFNNDGIVTTSFGIDAQGNTMAIQSNGKIVVAGTAYANAALARYKVDPCTPTATFQYDTVCAGQSFVVGNSTYTASGTYTNVFNSLVDECDSTITTNLTVLPANTFTQTPTVCAGQSFTVGGNTYTANGVYTNVFPSLVNGCDSSVTTHLTVLPANTFSQSLLICAGQSFTVGGNTYTATGVYTNAFTSILNGCDSTVTTHLTVLAANTTSQSPIICAGESFIVGSNIYTSSGTYIDTLIAINTCDSIVTTNLTVNAMPIITTNVNGIEITADQTAAVYQWIDCNSNTPIVGATNQSFTPTVNGDYAVVVSLGACADTSACVSVTTVDVSDISNLDNRVSVYPNPFSFSTIIESDKGFKNASLQVYNVLGEEVKQRNNISGHSIVFYRDNLPSGLYFMMLTQDGKVISRSKVVVVDK